MYLQRIIFCCGPASNLHLLTTSWSSSVEYSEESGSCFLEGAAFDYIGILNFMYIVTYFLIFSSLLLNVLVHVEKNYILVHPKKYPFYVFSFLVYLYKGV